MRAASSAAAAAAAAAEEDVLVAVVLMAEWKSELRFLALERGICLFWDDDPFFTEQT